MTSYIYEHEWKKLMVGGNIEWHLFGHYMIVYETTQENWRSVLQWQTRTFILMSVHWNMIVSIKFCWSTSSRRSNKTPSKVGLVMKETQEAQLGIMSTLQLSEGESPWKTRSNLSLGFASSAEKQYRVHWETKFVIISKLRHLWRDYQRKQCTVARILTRPIG